VADVRSVNLLKIAAEAEVLRYRCMAARQGRRAAFGAVALLFVLAVLVLGELAAWLALYLHFAPIESTLILLGINLVGHFRLLPLSRSGTSFCRTGAITERWFADRAGTPGVTDVAGRADRAVQPIRCSIRSGCEANSQERHPLPQRLVTRIRNSRS
jgi:hypothetical protein